LGGERGGWVVGLAVIAETRRSRRRREGLEGTRFGSGLRRREFEVGWKCEEVAC